MTISIGEFYNSRSTTHVFGGAAHRTTLNSMQRLGISTSSLGVVVSKWIGTVTALPASLSRRVKTVLATVW